MLGGSLPKMRGIGKSKENSDNSISLLQKVILFLTKIKKHLIVLSFGISMPFLT